MLAQILQDMWVEPEVLEALSEEQRRILFLKMREEQVRRWKEREEKKEEGEGLGSNNHNTPKKASKKHVSWLLGRDGDVSVNVIGEVDEFRSSKLLKSLMNNRLQSDSMNGIQTVSLQSEGEARQHESKQEIQLLLDNNASVAPNNSSSEEEVDSGNTEGDPRDPEEEGGESGTTTNDNDNNNSPKGCSPPYRPHFSSHGNRLPPNAQLSLMEKPRPQDRVVACHQEEKPGLGGRVAELRKAFGAGSPATNRVPAYAKPPVPTKPPHLRIMSTPSLH